MSLEVKLFDFQAENSGLTAIRLLWAMMGHRFLPFLVVLAVNVGRKPAFDPAALVVVGPAAAIAVVLAGLEPIYVKIPHIGTDPVEPFHKL